ncbi:MAG: guanylate kinase [Bradymonadia bacterium]|jgi:guanylate kinase
MSILFIVSGASGAGKSTLCHRLMAEFPEFGMSVSTTTRAPRGIEEEGEAYHFVDHEEFAAMIERDEFAEWAEVHGNRYGTSKSAITRARQADRPLLFDIDYQGAESLMLSYPEAISSMVLPPNMAVLESRLMGRGTDAEDVVRRRMDKARAEMAHAESFQHLIVNDELEAAYGSLRAVYLSAQTRTSLVWPSIRTEFDL